MIKSKASAGSKSEDTLDVNSLLDQYEETPIVPGEMPMDETSDSANQSAEQKPEGMNDKLKEDLKMSYEAKGILDITYGGYGFLRQDYAINPDRDIYVSTSQIRRFQHLGNRS
jgi:transcription termination factor Rho